MRHNQDKSRGRHSKVRPGQAETCLARPVRQEQPPHRAGQTRRLTILLVCVTRRTRPGAVLHRGSHRSHRAGFRSVGQHSIPSDATRPVGRRDGCQAAPPWPRTGGQIGGRDSPPSAKWSTRWLRARSVPPFAPMRKLFNQVASFGRPLPVRSAPDQLLPRLPVVTPDYS